MASAIEGKALRITQGNVDNNHIPITYVKELFPSDSFGGGRKDAAGVAFEVTLDGVGTFETDIAKDKNILRIRKEGAIASFYKLSGSKDGTRLFFEKVGRRSFRITAIN